MHTYNTTRRKGRGRPQALYKPARIHFWQASWLKDTGRLVTRCPAMRTKIMGFHTLKRRFSVLCSTLKREDQVIVPRYEYLLFVDLRANSPHSVSRIRRCPSDMLRHDVVLTLRAAHVNTCFLRMTG